MSFGGGLCYRMHPVVRGVSVYSRAAMQATDLLRVLSINRSFKLGDFLLITNAVLADCQDPLPTYCQVQVATIDLGLTITDFQTYVFLHCVDCCMFSNCASLSGGSSVYGCLRVRGFVL